MKTDSMQKEIVDLERKYWEAMKSNDVEAAIALTKFPCVVTGPKGAMRVSEQEYRKMMQSMIGKINNGVELQNPQVDMLSENTALISYSIDHDGKKMLDVSTWVKESGKWICAFHSENQIQ